MNLNINFNPNYKPLKIQNLNTLKIIEKSKFSQKFNIFNIQETEIKSILKLPCKWKQVYKIQFKKKLSYTPGDSISIIAPNTTQIVDELFRFLKLKDFNLIIEHTKFKYEGSLRDFFLNVFDFNSIPKKAFFYDIKKYSKYEKVIEYLCSKEGTRDYFRIDLNVLELLKIFKCKPSIYDLLMNCQIIRPRKYSLINKSENECEILVGIIKRKIFSDYFDENFLENIIQNLRISGNNDMKKKAYNFLKDNENKLENNNTETIIYTKNECFNDHKKENLNIDINKEKSVLKYGHISSLIKADQFKKVSISLSENKLLRLGNSKNILCICTGTGIAPFISFLNNKKEDQFIKIIYGFRNIEDDLLTYVNFDHRNVEIIKILSCNKIYVTDYLLDNINEINQFISKDCQVYVCGRAEMEKKVFQIFCDNFKDIIEKKNIFFDDWS